MFGLTALEIRALAIVALLAAGVAGAAWIYTKGSEHGTLACQAEIASAKLQASEDARAEEQRRTAAAKEVSDETHRLLERTRVSGAALDAAAPGLRAAAVAACGTASDPAPGSVIAAAAAEPDLRSVVFGEIEARLRGLAKEADARGAGGTGCVGQYQGLTPPPKLSLDQLVLGR